MQSHLTRRVFRALLNSEPVCFAPRRNRVYRVYPLSPIVHTQQACNRGVQSRGFFSFPSPVAQDATDVPASEVGLAALNELRRSKMENLRRPPFNSVCKGFQDFIGARLKDPGVLTDYHVKCLLTAWEYIRHHQRLSNGKEWQIISTHEFLESILYVLSHATCHADSHHTVRTLAHNVYYCLATSLDSEESLDGIGCDALLAYIRILALYGNPVHAERLTMDYWGKLKCSPGFESQESPWLWVIKGFALKHDRTRVENLIATLALEYDYVVTPLLHERLVEALIAQDRVHPAKMLYSIPLPMDGKQTVPCQIAVSKASIMNGDIAFAEKILQPHLSAPNSQTRDVLLLMEAAKGSNASALTQKLERWSKKDSSIRDDLSVSCVNNLMRYANSISNSKLAVEYSDLISKWNLEALPDTVLLLKLESVIQASDIQGALELLRSLEVTGGYTDLSLSMRYQLIKLLCQAPNDDAAYDQVSNLLDPLIEDNVHLEAETLAALTWVLAIRHKWDGLAELLRPRLSSYSLADERPLIRTALLNFIHKKDEWTTNTWQCYQLLRHAFPDTSTENWVAIMNLFFERKDTQKGCHVFMHMRHANRLDLHPTAETYTACFVGLSRDGNREDVKLIRNMLRLDVNIELNTRLRNALMLALISCGSPTQAMDEFRDILRSDEGPSQNTLPIFFRACESLPDGVHEAQKMAQKIQALEIPMDRTLCLAYVRVFAVQAKHNLLVQALDEIDSKFGLSPDSNMYVSFF